MSRLPPEYSDYSECMNEVQYRSEVVNDLAQLLENEIMNQCRTEEDRTGTLSCILCEKMEALIKWVRRLPPTNFTTPKPKPVATASADAVEPLQALVTATYDTLPPEGKARFCSFMADFLEREVVRA